MIKYCFLLWVILAAFVPTLALPGEITYYAGDEASTSEQIIAEVLDNFIGQLNRQMMIESMEKREFDRAFTDMLEEMTLRLARSVSSQDAPVSCDQACAHVSLGFQLMRQADREARGALVSCPTSLFAIEAAYYTESALQPVAQALRLTCDDTVNKSDAIIWLNLSINRTIKAIDNALYSYFMDECEASATTMGTLGDAFSQFHYALNILENCQQT